MDENAVGIVMILFAGVMLLAFFAFYVWSLIWLYNDAEQRSKSGCIITLLVAIFAWPWGILIWLVARPDHHKRLP